MQVTCRACLSHVRESEACTPHCASALRVARRLYPLSAPGKIRLPPYDPVARIVARICSEAKFDARAWQNSSGDFVLPARMAHGICASIALRHIGSNGGGEGEKRGTKRAAHSEEQERKEARVAEDVQQDLRTLGAVSPSALTSLAVLPPDAVAHVLSFLDYSAIVAFRASSRAGRDFVDKYHLLFNFSNTKALLNNMIKACIERDLALFETCARSCALIMPALLPMFTGALMGLCCFISKTEDTGNYTINNRAEHLVGRYVDETRFWKETRQKWKTILTAPELQQLTAEERIMRRMRIVLGFEKTSRFKYEQLRMLAPGLYNEMATTDAKKLTKILETQASCLTMRESSSVFLAWLYLDLDGPMLDPDKTLFCTCWIDPNDGGWLNVGAELNKDKMFVLPDTMAVPLKIMARCSMPEVTVGAFFDTNKAPLVFTTYAVLCGYEAMTLAAKAGCLTEMIWRVFPNTTTTDAWYEEARRFARDQFSGNWLLHLKQSGVQTDRELNRIYNEMEQEWIRSREHTALSGAALSVQYPPPAGADKHIIELATESMNEGSKILFDISDRGFVNSLFAPTFGTVQSHVWELFESQPSRSNGPTILLDALEDRVLVKMLGGLPNLYIFHEPLLKLNWSLLSSDVPALTAASLTVGGDGDLFNAEIIVSKMQDIKQKHYVTQCYKFIRNVTRPRDFTITGFNNLLPANLAAASASDLLTCAQRELAMADFFMNLFSGGRNYANDFFNISRLLEACVDGLKLSPTELAFYEEHRPRKTLIPKFSFTEGQQEEVQWNELSRADAFRILRSLDFALMRRRIHITDTADPSLQFTNPAPRVFYGRSNIDGFRFSDEQTLLIEETNPVTGLKVFYNRATLLRLVDDLDLPIESVSLAAFTQKDLDEAYVAVRPGLIKSVPASVALTQLGAGNDIANIMAKYEREPLLLRKRDDGSVLLLDGAAQLVKAKHMGIDRVPARYVSQETLKFAIDSDRTLAAARARRHYYARPPIAPPTLMFYPATAAAAAAAAPPVPAPATSLSVAPPSTGDVQMMGARRTR